MSRTFVLSVDQSTQGTKAVLFAEDGTVVAKTARPHDQIVNEKTRSFFPGAGASSIISSLSVHMHCPPLITSV